MIARCRLYTAERMVDEYVQAYSALLERRVRPHESGTEHSHLRALLDQRLEPRQRAFSARAWRASWRRMGHEVRCYEEIDGWSLSNLVQEGEAASQAIDEFPRTYPELDVRFYRRDETLAAFLNHELAGADLVLIHEWNEPEVVQEILARKARMGFRALFHDTHHRAYTNAAEILRLPLQLFDGVLAFGEAIRRIYADGFGVARVWTFHEAADISVFHPIERPKQNDVVWIGNWGDEERTAGADGIPGRARRAAGRRAAARAGARSALSAAGEGDAAPLGNRIRGLSAEPERAGALCAQPAGAARAAPPVCQRTERRADDSRLRGAGLRHSAGLRAVDGYGRTVPRGKDYLVARDGEEMLAPGARTAASEGARRRACSEWAGDHPAASYLQASRRAVDGDLRRNRAMRIFVFGSSITSSYWNGAATYYRGIYKNLAALGHEITFAEPDIYNRQQNRDLSEVEYAKVIVYQTPRDIDELIGLASTCGPGDQAQRRGQRRRCCWSGACWSAARRTCRLRSGMWMLRRRCSGWRAIRAIRSAAAFRSTISSSPTAAARRWWSAIAGWERAAAIRSTTRSIRRRIIAEAADPALACDLVFVGNRLPDRERRVEQFFLRAAELAPEMSFVLGGEGWGGKPLPPNVRWIGHVGTGGAQSHQRLGAHGAEHQSRLDGRCWLLAADARL